MKYDWKKQDKQFYLPKNKPEFITIPKFSFFSISGEGNPNDSFFGDYISVLYTLSYAAKMSSRKGLSPEGYFDFTVFPLEGVWDINDAAKRQKKEVLDKNDLVFSLMIRQPEFVSEEFFRQIVEKLRLKKAHSLLENVKFEQVEEGKCIQMMHLGSYDNEPASFALMEQFASGNNLHRLYKTHREIYISDARKTLPEKLKTVLRFQVV